MKSSAFQYAAPRSTDEAVGLLAELGDDAKVLAGGQSLIPLMALRLAAFEYLVDVGRIESLRGTERHDGAMWIGAGTTEATIERSAEVATAVPLLARATPFIGHFQIRNRGTVGGSIAHADSAAEYPAVALAMDAELELASTRGVRSVAAADFFTGHWSTVAEPDELLTGVRFPIWSGRCGSAVEEFARRRGDFAITGAVVAVQIDADDRVSRCAIGLIGMGSTPLRAVAAEAEAVGRSVREVDPAEVGRRSTADLTDVPGDLHGSPEYRTRVGAVMVERAWTQASEEAQHA